MVFFANEIHRWSAFSGRINVNGGEREKKRSCASPQFKHRYNDKQHTQKKKKPNIYTYEKERMKHCAQSWFRNVLCRYFVFPKNITIWNRQKYLTSLIEMFSFIRFFDWFLMIVNELGIFVLIRFFFFFFLLSPRFFSFLSHYFLIYFAMLFLVVSNLENNIPRFSEGRIKIFVTRFFSFNFRGSTVLLDMDRMKCLFSNYESKKTEERKKNCGCGLKSLS